MSKVLELAQSFEPNQDPMATLKNKLRLGEDVQRSINNHVELLRSTRGLLSANRQGDTGQIGLCQRYWQTEGGMSESKK